MSHQKQVDHRCSSEERFASLLSFHLADVAAGLGDTLIRCNEMTTTGRRHRAIVCHAFNVVSRLSRLTGETLPTCKLAESTHSSADLSVSEAVHVLMCFLETFFQVPTKGLSFTSMMATRTFCPHIWHGGQHPVTWLALKAIFSIDENEAETAAALIIDRLPNRLGEVTFLAFMMNTPFAAQLVKTRREDSRPFLEAFYKLNTPNMVTGVELVNMLTYDVTESRFADLFKDPRGIDFLKRAEWAMARYEFAHRQLCLSSHERIAPPFDDWDVLRKNVLNIVEMGQVIIRSRHSWPTIILWVYSNEGFRCFARRLWYRMQDFPSWSKVCAADICSCVQSVFEAEGLHLSKPITKEERQVTETFHESEKRWTTECLDDESKRRLDEIKEETQAVGYPPIPAQSTFVSFAIVGFAIISRAIR